jgi:hypothetical protein
MVPFVSVLLVLALLSSFGSAHASIGGHNWIAPLVKNNSDAFLGYVEAGYVAGSTATLVVNVQNGLAFDMNVSAVKVWFDWGQNYSSTDVNLTKIYSIDPGLSHVFTVVFTIPDITVATNLVTHNYKIYVDDVNSTTGVKGQLNTNFPYSGTYFAVFSTEQASAINTVRELNKYDTGFIPFITAQGRELSMLADGTRTEADRQYGNGDFTNAANTYQDALNMMQNAWGNETKVWTDYQNGFEGIVTGIPSMMTMMGIGYALFGLGFFFMGIGVIVWAARKPKTS